MQMNEIYSLGCFQVFKQGGASTARHTQWGAFGCKFLWLSNCVCMSVTLPKSASILHPLLFWFRSTFQSLLGLLGLLLCKQEMQDPYVIIVDSSAYINFSLDWKTVGMCKALITSSSFTPAWTAAQPLLKSSPCSRPLRVSPSSWVSRVQQHLVLQSTALSLIANKHHHPHPQHATPGWFCKGPLSWTWNEVFSGFPPLLGILGLLTFLSRRP